MRAGEPHGKQVNIFLWAITLVLASHSVILKSASLSSHIQFINNTPEGIYISQTYLHVCMYIVRDYKQLSGRPWHLEAQ